MGNDQRPKLSPSPIKEAEHQSQGKDHNNGVEFFIRMLKRPEQCAPHHGWKHTPTLQRVDEVASTQEFLIYRIDNREKQEKRQCKPTHCDPRLRGIPRPRSDDVVNTTQNRMASVVAANSSSLAAAPFHESRAPIVVGDQPCDQPRKQRPSPATALPRPKAPDCW